MNTTRLIDEALAVAWIERTKGGHRAADVIEQLLEEVRRLRAVETPRFVIGPPVKDERSVRA